MQFHEKEEAKKIHINSLWTEIMAILPHRPKMHQMFLSYKVHKPNKDLEIHSFIKLDGIYLEYQFNFY